MLMNDDIFSTHIHNPLPTMAAPLLNIKVEGVVNA